MYGSPVNVPDCALPLVACVAAGAGVADFVGTAAALLLGAGAADSVAAGCVACADSVATGVGSVVGAVL